MKRIIVVIAYLNDNSRFLQTIRSLRPVINKDDRIILVNGSPVSILTLALGVLDIPKSVFIEIFEPPKGVYAAHYAAIIYIRTYSLGHYIWFLNCGDCLASSCSREALNHHLSLTDSSCLFLFGQVISSKYSLIFNIGAFNHQALLYHGSDISCYESDIKRSLHHPDCTSYGLLVAQGRVHISDYMLVVIDRPCVSLKPKHVLSTLAYNLKTFQLTTALRNFSSYILLLCLPASFYDAFNVIFKVVTKRAHLVKR